MQTDNQNVSVWLKLRASLYEAQNGLGARLVSANPPPPPVRLVSAPLRAPRQRQTPRPPMRLGSAKPQKNFTPKTAFFPFAGPFSEPPPPSVDHRRVPKQEGGAYASMREERYGCTRGQMLRMAQTEG